MKRALRVLAVLTGLALALVGTMAVAAWLSSGTAGATATATSVDKAHQPTATRGSGQVSLSWTASTLASGAPVGGYQVLRHGASTTTTVCTVVTPAHSCTDNSPVATSVTYGVVATAGTGWRGPESDLTSFTYDDVAPVTTADVSPSPNAATWNNTAVTVTLNAADSGNPSSGVDHIHYSLDGGTAVDHAGATATFPVSGAGTHTVTYFAVDGVGNTETAHGNTVRIDPSAPVTTATPSTAANAAGWNNAPVTLSFSATDVDASGVKSVTVDGVTTSGSTASRTVSTEGTTTVSYFATDVADNVEGTKTTTLKIDKTAPTVSISPISDSSAWRTANTASITATDATSGVASIAFKLNGAGSFTSVSSSSATVTGLAEGTNTIVYRATDVAGNVTADATATIKVDTVVPTASLSQTGSGQPTISGADATSGVASVSWRDGNSGAYTTVTGSSTTLSLSNGSHTIWYFATDNAGNASTPTSRVITVSLDTVAPTFSGVMNGRSPLTWSNNNPGNGSWNQDACAGNQVCAVTTDGGTPTSGIKSSTIYFTLTGASGVNNSKCWDGSSFISASGNPSGCKVAMAYDSSTGRITATVPQGSMLDGTYTLKLHAEDNAGNIGEQTVTLTIT